MVFKGTNFYNAVKIGLFVKFKGVVVAVVVTDLVNLLVVVLVLGEQVPS